jgi:hypothetical protein
MNVKIEALKRDALLKIISEGHGIADEILSDCALNGVLKRIYTKRIELPPVQMTGHERNCYHNTLTDIQCTLVTYLFELEKKGIITINTEKK